ncbi:acyl-CoA carboxylase epsilon subunit [Streptomyces sp. NPDC023723]|uniref:acyl-CoA carboxylase epsilon subunit n=1 Tax=Streptomyces sp. NPDC023723 TaxID=3154323 RepID=UPI0033DF6B69
MERVSEPGPAAGPVRILRGTPDAHETAALLVLLARLGGAPEQPRPRPVARPTWQPFTAHSPGGWRHT